MQIYDIQISNMVEKPKVFILKNGLTVALMPMKSVETVTIHLKGLAGSNYEDESSTGAAHLVEHMSLFKGEKPLFNSITDKGIAYYGVTSRDSTLFMTKSLGGLENECLKFLKQVFENFDFSQSKLENIKESVKNEVARKLEIPEKIIGLESNKILFPNTRLSKFNTGDSRDIGELSIKKLLNFKKTHYQYSNFVLVAAGNFNLKDMRNNINKLFSGQNNQHLRLYLDFQANKNIAVLKVPGNKFGQTHIKVDFEGVKLSSDLCVPLELLSEIFKVRLQSELKDITGYSYIVSCVSFSSINYGIFSIYTACHDKNAKDTLKIIVKTVNEICKKDISPKELFKIKQTLNNHVIFDLEKVSGRVEYYSETLLNNVPVSYKTDSITNVNLKAMRISQKYIYNQNPKISFISDSLTKKEVLKIASNRK